MMSGGEERSGRGRTRKQWRQRNAPGGGSGRASRGGLSRPRMRRDNEQTRGGARGAEQLGLRVGDDVHHDKVRRRCDRRPHRQRRQGPRRGCGSRDVGEKKTLLLSWAPLARVLNRWLSTVVDEAVGDRVDHDRLGGADLHVLDVVLREIGSGQLVAAGRTPARVPRSRRLSEQPLGCSNAIGDDPVVLEARARKPQLATVGDEGRALGLDTIADVGSLADVE